MTTKPDPATAPTYDEIRKAASMLIEAGFALAIPGWYSIHTPEEAAEFSQDPEAYYRKLHIEAGQAEGDRLAVLAREAGMAFGHFIHAFMYCQPSRFFRWTENMKGRDGNSHSALYTPRCSFEKVGGELCRRPVKWVQGNVKSFRRGIDDRCSRHRRRDAGKVKR